MIGTGSLGTHHARLYSSSEKVGDLFLFDRLPERAAAVAAEYGARACAGIDELLERCDAVSICTPATDHCGTAARAFDSGVDVLVEKPIASDSKDAREMVRLARENSCVFQVGHIERFNGTFQAVRPLIGKPLFIESHRLGIFTPRGTDVSVVVDLMIHDIDIVLTLLGGDPLVELRASGAGILTDSPDIVNARLEFESGCVANLTASRISREPLRKIRFFQENMYISADFRAKKVEAFRRSDRVVIEQLASDPTAFIEQIGVEVDQGEPLKKEIEAFLDAVIRRGETEVTGEEALAALEIAEKVLDCLNGSGDRK